METDARRKERSSTMLDLKHFSAIPEHIKSVMSIAECDKEPEGQLSHI